jgi:hypothetical protein
LPIPEQELAKSCLLLGSWPFPDQHAFILTFLLKPGYDSVKISSKY